MRQLFTTRRWLTTHVLMVVVVLGFVVLGWWQFKRGEGGNARSYIYALEWPSFALLVFGFWGKIIYDELHPRQDADGTPDPNGVRSRRGAYGDTGSLASGPGGPAAAQAVQGAAPGQFTDIGDGTADAGAGDDDPELAAYNRYLAELASMRGGR